MVGTKKSIKKLEKHYALEVRAMRKCTIRVNTICDYKLRLSRNQQVKPVNTRRHQWVIAVQPNNILVRNTS